MSYNNNNRNAYPPGDNNPTRQADNRVFQETNTQDSGAPQQQPIQGNLGYENQGNNSNPNNSNLVGNAQTRPATSQQNNDSQRNQEFSPDRRTGDRALNTTGSVNAFGQSAQYEENLRPVFPKIIDSVQPLMYDTNFGSVQRQQGEPFYKFQDKGMPVLINYRALQNKQKNQQIPVGILIEYFQQWIEIMKVQIDTIVNNLYIRASCYYEKSISELFKEILMYNQKYMKYIMLSIIPSREIHQNPILNKVEQTLSRQNLKLTTCQHCYDFTNKCEEYVDKVLSTENMIPKENVSKDIQEIKNSFKLLIQDVECKQIFKKFTSILEKNYLLQFADDAQKTKDIFSRYNEFRRQIVRYTDIDLTDIESYDRDDALEVFSEWLPKGDQIIDDLNQIASWNLPKKIKDIASDYRSYLIHLTGMLQEAMKAAPCFILLSIEQVFSSKFRLNMDPQSVRKLMQEQLESNTHFLNTVGSKIEFLKEVFDNFLNQHQQQFQVKWNALIDCYDSQIGSFISKLKGINPEQELSIDVEQTNLFDNLQTCCKNIENLYLDLWNWFGKCRSELGMPDDLSEEDQEVIPRELGFIELIQITSQNIRKGFYEAKFLTADPISLMDPAGLEVQAKNIEEFKVIVVRLQSEFHQLQSNNLLNRIFKVLTVKDPLMYALLDKRIVDVVDQVISKPSLESIKDKINYFYEIQHEIGNQQVKESTPEKLIERLEKLFRNLIYSEMKAPFKYEDIPEIKLKLQKSITDIVNTDTQADLNDFYQKNVRECLDKLAKLQVYVEQFSYTDFEQIQADAQLIGDTYEIYNAVIGKQTEHVKLQQLKDVLEATYVYFFSQQNPPMTQIISIISPFLNNLQQNIKRVDEFLKKNLKGFESLGNIMLSQKQLLQKIEQVYQQFNGELKQWNLYPIENMATLIVPLKNWFMHVHQKVFQLESKRLRNQIMYMNVMEEKELSDIANDKVIRNKFFGLKSAMGKSEIDKLKQNNTPIKQEKWEIVLEWEQKPKQTKLIIDVFLPFKGFQCGISTFDDSDSPVQVYNETLSNENVFKNTRIELEVEMKDIYIPIQVSIKAYDESQFKRVSYERTIFVSNLEKETKLLLSEVGMQFQPREEWKIYVKCGEKINWNPCIKVCQVKSQPDKEKGMVVEFTQEVSAKQQQLDNISMDEAQQGSHEFTINGGGSNKKIYFFVIECDGCEKDLPSNDHKVFVNGKTEQAIPQTFTYSNSDTQLMRKEKPIWMLGYIKEGIYYKTGVFIPRSEVEEHFQLAIKEAQ